MKSIMKPLQTKITDIYSEFKKICDTHGLRYFAIQGTTLGAIFWEGFIPWDDDMDIAMPFDDFEKFKKLSAELPDWLEFEELLWLGGKIYDSRTTLIEPEYFQSPERYRGVFLDITILVGLPNDIDERNIFMQKIKHFQHQAFIDERYSTPSNNNILKLKKERQKLLKQYPFGTTEFVTDFPSGSYYYFKTEGFQKPIEKKFDKTTVYISSTYDFDLTSRYGKYVKEPDEAERWNHTQESFVDLDHPYIDYQNRFKELPEWVKVLIRAKHIKEGLWYKAAADMAEWVDNRDTKVKEMAAELDNIKNSSEYMFGKKWFNKYAPIIKAKNKILKGIKK